MTNEVVVSRQRLKKYLCACGKAYNRPALLEQHKRVHTGEQPFACTECDARFTRRSFLTKHMLKHVPPDEKPFKCPECGKGVNTQQHLDQHMGLHRRPFTCPRENCEETFRYQAQLDRHLIRHDRTCCGTIFPTHKKYLTHIERNHSQKYNCGLCDTSFDKIVELQKHIASAHKKTPTPVDPADPLTSEPSAETSNPSEDSELVKSSQKPPIGPTISRITGVGYDERPIACPKCDKRFFRQYDLDRHTTSSH